MIITSIIKILRAHIFRTFIKSEPSRVVGRLYRKASKEKYVSYTCTWGMVLDLFVLCGYG